MLAGNLGKVSKRHNPPETGDWETWGQLRAIPDVRGAYSTTYL